MRADEIREMGREDMETRVRELQEEQFRLKFRSATEPLEDPLRLRVIRRDIAIKAMALAAAKMPVKTKFVAREEGQTDAS